MSLALCHALCSLIQKNGHKALQAAKIENNLEIVNHLLNAGIDVNIKDKVRLFFDRTQLWVKIKKIVHTFEKQIRLNRWIEQPFTGLELKVKSNY